MQKSTVTETSTHREFFTPVLADGFPPKSNSKSPLVARTLLCILADLNNAVVWMVFTPPLISNSSCPNYNWYHRHLYVPYFLNSLAMSRYLSLFSPSFSFYFVVSRNGKVLNLAGSLFSFFFFLFFFFVYHSVWSSGRDWVICLYLKIPENFVWLIFLDGFRVVHIPFGRMVKFKLLAQFPVDHLSHIVPSYILSLR